MTPYPSKKIRPASAGEIDRRLIKHSAQRLVLSGGTFELYAYQRPYYYNWAPIPSSRGASSGLANAAPRREDNLSAARARIRRLINANKDAWGQRLKFVTYTFARNVRDLDEANSYWAEYIRRMRAEYGAMKYLAVVEFQKRGAIHYHVLFFNLPFIYDAKTRLSEMWEQGFIKIITVQHVRNLGAYISKYLQKDIMDKRLIGEKAFFCSKGLHQPEEYRNESRIAKILAGCMLSVDVEKSYVSSHYGAINYKQGNLTPIP